MEEAQREGRTWREVKRLAADRSRWIHSQQNNQIQHHINRRNETAPQQETKKQRRKQYSNAQKLTNMEQQTRT
jgi:hypothetical protein